jgi:hypothetical protein
MRIPILLAVAVAANILAQDVPVIQIQGRVLDRTTRSPIAGARVYATVIGSTGPSTPISGTDGGGLFTLASVPLGSKLSLVASAEGYQGGEQVPFLASASAGFIEIALDRLAEIRGRLVDDATREPSADLTMALVRAGDRLASTTPMGATASATAADGTFSFKNLYRDDYYLRIQSKPLVRIEEIPAKELEGENRAKALQVPEPAEGYGAILWPGEDAIASNTPPLALAAEVMDVGDIRLRRYKLHNLTGVLGPCEEGTSLQVLILGKNGGGTVRLADLDTKCGAGFRILNLPNGTFTLIAQGGPPRVFASETIDGFMRSPLQLNVTTAVTVQIRIEVEGVDADKFPADIQRVNISMTPESAPFKVDGPSQIAPNEYEERLFGNERYRMSVTPPPAYYLKSLYYNGVASPVLTGFTAVSASLSTLRLILSNHPGVVEAQAPAGSSVILWKEGTRYPDAGLDRSTFQRVGPDGTARFVGLSPGKYRAFMTPDTAPMSTTQERLDEAMLHAIAVTVEEGQTTRVSLTP